MFYIIYTTMQGSLAPQVSREWKKEERLSENVIFLQCVMSSLVDKCRVGTPIRQNFISLYRSFIRFFKTNLNFSAAGRLVGAMVTIPWVTVKKRGRPSFEVPVPRITFPPDPKSNCSGSSFSDEAEVKIGQAKEAFIDIYR